MLLFAALLTVAWASCPENYHHDPDTNRCLRVFTQPRNFFNAQLQCTRDDGELGAMPTSKNILDRLPKKVFTGLNRMLSKEWKHLDGTPVSPLLVFSLSSEASKGQCTSYNTEKSSHEIVGCETVLPFVCSRPFLKDAPAQQDSCPPCPNCNCYANCDDGWTYLGKTASCYKTFFGPGNYSYSEGVCQNNRAHLVSIHSDAENEFVIDLSSTGKQQSSSYQVWIGLYLNLGRWSWSDGSPTDYIVWTSGSPFGSYDSGFIYADMNTNSGYRYGQWDVEYGYRTMRAFVCKKSANAV